MNILYDIQGSGRSGKGLLLCEWGSAYCCIALMEPETGLLHRLKYWSLEEPLSEEAARPVIEQLQSWAQQGSRVVFASAFAESLLVPQKLSAAPGKLFPSLFPGKSTVHEDRVGEWQLINAYAFPAPLDALLRRNFPDAEYFHVFTPALKYSAAGDASGHLQVCFAPGQFRVVVKKDGRLQLAQVYRYSAPLDVVYYLLRILSENGLTQADTTLSLAGLIDEESALYRELHQYFSGIRFNTPDGVAAEGGRPAHLFTSLYNLARCAS